MENKKTSRIDIFGFLYKYGTILVTILAMVYFSLTLDNFLNFNNITNIFGSVSIVALVGLAITISLTINGFDLAVGATAGFAAVIAAKIMVIWGFGVVPAILVPLLVGVLIGAVNAFLIIKIGIQDMLATLSMMFLLTGISITFQDGSAIYNYMPLPDGSGTAEHTISEAFLYIGKGKLFGVPVPVYIMLVVATMVHIFLNYTKYGRYMYMIGGNPEAARLFQRRLVVPVLRHVIAAWDGETARSLRSPFGRA